MRFIALRWSKNTSHLLVFQNKALPLSYNRKSTPQDTAKYRKSPVERKLPVKYVLQNRKISPDSVRFVQIRLRVGTNSIKLYQFGTDLL